MNRKILRKAVPILLILLLAFFGGTARNRASGDAASLMPSPSEKLPTESVSSAALHAPASTEATSPAAEQPEASVAPEQVSAKTFTLTFIGDCTLASVPSYQGTSVGYDKVVGEDMGYPFAKTKQYFEDDDFTFANLECCLTDSKSPVAKTFTFKADESYADIMAQGGVEFVTLANNHILDYGDEGVADTEAALDKVGIAYAGRDEYALYETESGLKIGVYAVSFGTVEQIRSGIGTLRDMGAEFVIAALHWGVEGSYTPDSDQIAQGHAAIDAGADIVYGSHPHTLQPVEEYNGHCIYYSMGNWSFGGNTNPRDKDTFILRLTVERQTDGSTSITNREHIPCASSGIADGNNYQPVPYEKDSAEYDRVLSKLDGSFSGADLSIGYSYSSNE